MFRLAISWRIYRLSQRAQGMNILSCIALQTRELIHKFNQDQKKFEQVNISTFVLPFRQIFTLSPTKFVVGII
jgi:hypothetical protein